MPFGASGYSLSPSLGLGGNQFPSGHMGPSTIQSQRWHSCAGACCAVLLCAMRCLSTTMLPVSDTPALQPARRPSGVTI